MYRKARITRAISSLQYAFSAVFATVTVLEGGTEASVTILEGNTEAQR